MADTALQDPFDGLAGQIGLDGTQHGRWAELSSMVHKPERCCCMHDMAPVNCGETSLNILTGSSMHANDLYQVTVDTGQTRSQTFQEDTRTLSSKTSVNILTGQMSYCGNP